jgi:hypothetical protein
VGSGLRCPFFLDNGGRSTRLTWEWPEVTKRETGPILSRAAEATGAWLSQVRDETFHNTRVCSLGCDEALDQRMLADVHQATVRQAEFRYGG